MAQRQSLNEIARTGESGIGIDGYEKNPRSQGRGSNVAKRPPSLAEQPNSCWGSTEKSRRRNRNRNRILHPIIHRLHRRSTRTLAETDRLG